MQVLNQHVGNMSARVAISVRGAFMVLTAQKFRRRLLRRQTEHTKVPAIDRDWAAATRRG